MHRRHDIGGIVHTYLRYDPQRFPLPAQQRTDLVSPAFEHLMVHGHLGGLTPAQLADAIEIDPSQISGLGPSIQSLLARLEERKRRILETYEVSTVRQLARHNWTDAASRTRPPKNKKDRFRKATRQESIVALEALWYAVDQRSHFARELVLLIDHLANHLEVETLVSKYVFSGRKELGIEQAIATKEELELIDKLIEQLKEAAKNAKIVLINLDELSQFVSEDEIDNLRSLQEQIRDVIEHAAAAQGLRRQGSRYELTSKAMKLFQSKLLSQIFANLQAAKSGRHNSEMTGEGAVESLQTKAYEFGDSLANMDVVASLTNAMIRVGSAPAQLTPADIEIHHTKNRPKCATCVCMDMSGSMRYAGQYVNVKRMALALHGLVLKEYPGDFLEFIEICTLPKRRHISEVAELLPRPVTIHDPVVRLKADMSDDQITEFDIHPHFTNIQRSLQLSRQLLQVQDTINRQIILITDGMPTAHFEDKWLYMLYPPERRTEKMTLMEARRCAAEGITINVFLLSSWSQTEQDIHFAHRLAEQSAGRVFFVGGEDLDRLVIWDYINKRRLILG